MKALGSQRGVTLLETLLVMVIFSMMLIMGVNYVQQRAANLRLDRTALQMQQILNAGLSYYVANGKWPESATLTDLQPDYISSDTVKSPWGTTYTIGYTNKGTFYVWVPIKGADSGEAAVRAKLVAGKLPFGYISSDAGTGGGPLTGVTPVEDECDDTDTCYAVSYVNIPGQNLNNATAVNYAGLYHHGACVPVPECPVDKDGNTMTPQIMVIPVSVSGVNDEGSKDVYPISSFTAYATGSTDVNGDLTNTPPLCDGQSKVKYSTGTVTGTAGTDSPCKDLDLSTNEKAGTSYWRACLQVITERGDVQVSRNDFWGEDVTLLAITRCAITSEASGSAFTVYGN